MEANLKIEGKPAAPFVVYLCNLDEQPCQRLAEYYTIADVLDRKRRFDEVIKISVGRTFLTWPEFVDWSKAQEGS